MKAIFVILFCGLSSALAFDCNQDYPRECPNKMSLVYPYPDTAEKLDNYCGAELMESLDCNIAFSKECPKTLSAAHLKMLEYMRFFWGKICEKGNPMRQTFLEKASCLIKEEKSADTHCRETIHEKEWCKKGFAITKCTEEELIDRCGADGRNMISELFKTRFAFYEIYCRTQ